MTEQRFLYYCKLCNKEFKGISSFAQDLHIRQIHGAKVIGDAVKQYTTVIIMEDFKR